MVGAAGAYCLRPALLQLGTASELRAGLVVNWWRPDGGSGRRQ